MRGAIESIALKKESSMPCDKTMLIKVAVVIVAAYASAGAETAGGMFPFGIAYMAAAIKRSRLSIYLLPAVLGGLAVRIATGVDVFGDAAAVLLVTLVFLLAGKRAFADWQRVVIAMAVTVICNVAYFTAADLLYRFNSGQLLTEIAAVAVGYFLFDKAGDMLFSQEKIKEETKEAAVVATCTAVSVILCGIVPAFVGEIALGGAFFFVALFGYRFGVSSGVAGAAAAALSLYFCGFADISGIYGFLGIGMCTGLFKGLNKYTAALVFAAVGSLLGNVLPAVGAALLFALVPERFISRLDGKFAISSAKGEECLNVLARYKRCFASLAKLYSIEKNSRSIISYQFRGMEQTVDRLMADITGSETELQAVTDGMPRYRAQVAVSTYSSHGGVSGDSYACRRLADGRHIFILSDGMGKGAAAAAESNLAVRTLSDLTEAGFDIETSLRTLNSILLLKSEDEIFSTIDIGVFDEKTGRLKLYKIGAASTFIKRKGDVKSVKMAALPMGIIDDLRIDFVSVRLRPNDQIVMVSDGVIDSVGASGRDSAPAAWLTAAIAGIKSKDPQTMADLIINRAVENYGLREKDDLTVISILIK